MANQNYTRKSATQLVRYKLINGLDKSASFLKRNLNNIGNLTLAISPFAFFMIGQYAYADRGYYAFGGEVVLYVAVPAVAFFLKAMAKEQWKPLYIPVPTERFTHYEGDGEYTMEQARIPELILYMAELEDWFEDEGYVQKPQDDARDTRRMD